jgi:hypothetical protein
MAVPRWRNWDLMDRPRFAVSRAIALVLELPASSETFSEDSTDSLYAGSCWRCALYCSAYSGGRPASGLSDARAGWGLLAITLFHLVQTLSDAAGWLVLIPKQNKVRLTSSFFLHWLGESINNLLPAGASVETSWWHASLRCGECR